LFLGQAQAGARGVSVLLKSRKGEARGEEGQNDREEELLAAFLSLREGKREGKQGPQRREERSPTIPSTRRAERRQEVADAEQWCAPLLVLVGEWRRQQFSLRSLWRPPPASGRAITIDGGREGRTDGLRGADVAPSRAREKRRRGRPCATKKIP
jgi:hypothetical protein